MTAIDDLQQLGTATWLDDLSRDRLDSGNLAELIDTKSIVGVTTNPAIFATAMSQGTAYDAQIAELQAANCAPVDAVYAMAVDDVRRACDVFADVFARTDGRDGRVSIEVDPRISDDAESTLAQARELAKQVDRPGVMIKIPATEGSLPAITAALSEGISVNVTLIFSIACYRQVLQAFADGITQAAENGHDVSKIHSVASVFVSRLDAEVDARLAAIGTPEALALQGKAGIANARRAYQVYLDFVAENQLPAGANMQRLLWASTGVKNPDYPQDMYVVELAGPDTVNTMPEATIDATLAAKRVHGDTLTGTAEESLRIFEQLGEVGINFEEVFTKLEQEGVEKFVDSWESLLANMETRLAQ
ncbi:transaldolase [Corynebacterium choanae]|uniref:Transaldolase n=1 Tax=Corynebacterium choanae TaxID=1862358 RepID=A0A3G6J6A5_9CORY|nr:transaldolase [Corynebacterium choanae]AZA13625.1 Transaldolase [Corynebacterium choanae]